MSSERGVRAEGSRRCVPASALGTFQPEVLYQPPKLNALDHESHVSTEHVTVVRDGPDFVLDNLGAPFLISPKSDPGCEDLGSPSACPRAGVERVVVVLGGGNDSVRIDLGRSGHGVKQHAFGGSGEDELRGRGGKQKLKGGDGEDFARGGGGPDKLFGGFDEDADTLIGGRGDDFCSGGVEDTFIGCETTAIAIP